MPWLNKLVDLPAGTTYRRARRLLGRDPLALEPLMAATIIADDTTFWSRLVEADWKTSRGYGRSDGFQVGGHQYLDGGKNVTLLASLRDRLVNDPAAYRGEYGGYVYAYLDHDGWKYWIAGRFINRELLSLVRGVPDDGDAEA